MNPKLTPVNFCLKTLKTKKRYQSPKQNNNNHQKKIIT